MSDPRKYLESIAEWNSDNMMTLDHGSILAARETLAFLDAERAEHAKEVAKCRGETASSDALAVHWQGVTAEYVEKCADLQRQLKEARTVLKWYADEHNYVQPEHLSPDGTLHISLSPASVDAGQRARDAEGEKT